MIPRVLVVCQEDPEWILGGMGRHLQELYKAMAKQNEISVDLLVGGPSGESYFYNGYAKHHGEKLLCYKPSSPNMASLLISDIQLITTLMRLVAEGRTWDLLHVHEWNSIQTAWAARAALGIPLVGTMHLCITKLMEDDGDPSQYAETDIYLMQQEGHLIASVDELILCSQAYVRLIRKTFLTSRSINLIYNGVDMDYWHYDVRSAREAHDKFNLPNRPIALFVGRIADMKGIREILDAVQSNRLPYCVVLAGEINANTEEDKEKWDVTKLIRSIEEQYPSRLRWLGFSKRRELTPTLCRSRDWLNAFNSRTVWHCST
jgi:1,4-alpha-glucan branching enzyme